MTTELWQLSATELAARIARRETTARAATESVLARIAEVNPQVNALAHQRGLQAAHIFDRAALDRVPLMLTVISQQRVVAEKPDQRLRRKVHHAGGRCRPDRP